MKKRPTLTIARPTKTGQAPAMSGTARAASKLEDGEARLVVNLSGRAHYAIKLRAMERRLTIREYVLGLLERDGLDVR